MVGGGPEPVARARSRAPTRACCSSTSWPSSTATCSRRCASRSRRGASSIARAGRVDDLPGALPARRRDEPVPVRLSPAPCPRDAAGAPPGSVERYARRVSGPLRDRIDLWVHDAARSPSAALVAGREPEASPRWSPRGSRRPARVALAAAGGRPQRAAARPGRCARACRLSGAAAHRAGPAWPRARRRAAAARSDCSGSPARSPTWTDRDAVETEASRRGGLVSLAEARSAGALAS